MGLCYNSKAENAETVDGDLLGVKRLLGYRTNFVPHPINQLTCAGELISPPSWGELR